MIDKAWLTQAVALYGITLTPEQAEKLDTYARLLVEWNEKMNLTAITDGVGIAAKHFADSLSAYPHLPKTAFSLVDVGTGAGFPGVPLALVRSDCKLTLLDSLQKRLTFLDALCRELGIPVTLIHARAEEAGQNPAWREGFDVVTARAVAAMPVLCEYCLPLVKPGGRFIAMKGPDGERELTDAAKAIALLGGAPGVSHALTLAVPGGETQERRILTVDKIQPTPAKYPRPTAKMAKSPL